MRRTAVLFSALGFSLLTLGGVAHAEDDVSCYPVPENGCVEVEPPVPQTPGDDSGAVVELSLIHI